MIHEEKYCQIVTNETIDDIFDPRGFTIVVNKCSYNFEILVSVAAFSSWKWYMILIVGAIYYLPSFWMVGNATFGLKKDAIVFSLVLTPLLLPCIKTSTMDN